MRAYVARFVVAGALALAATSSFAQVTTSGDGGAGDFAGDNPPPPLGDPGDVVPGAGNDPGQWTAWGENPEGLIAAGEADAPGNEYLDVLGGGATNAARYDLSDADSWLDRSFDLLGDPSSEVGDLTGDNESSCRDETSQQTRLETSLYTCETATRVAEQSLSCKRSYVPTFDTDYIYACLTGEVWTNEPASCTRRRVVVVDEDYVYGCVQTWNGTRHAPNAACEANGEPGCAPSGGRVCAEPSGLPTSYTCQTGYRDNRTTHTCERTQRVVVGPEKYLVGGFMMSYTGTPIEQITAQTVQGYLPGCTITDFVRGALAVNFTPICPGGLPDELEWTRTSPDVWQASPSLNVIIGITEGMQNVDQGGGTTTNCGEYSGCTETRDVCVEPGGTRTIDGAEVHRDCWRWEVTYQCGSRENAAGCNPPAGMTQESSRCLWSDSGGVCRLRERTYIDPSGGCSRFEQDFRCEDRVSGAGTPDQIIRDVVSDTWDNGCHALQGNGACVLQGEAVIVGNQTRNINGLNVRRNPWEVREDYICSTSSNVNSCAPFTGCTRQSQTCASEDPEGRCTAWDRTYRCPEQEGSGEPTDTVTEHSGGSMTGGDCAADSFGACSVESTTCTEPGGTRMIDGVPVTAPCWEETDTYHCEGVDGSGSNCSPPSGCELQNSVCLEGSEDDCQLWDHEYQCTNEVVVEEQRRVCETRVCIGEVCISNEDAGDTDMPDALAALLIAQMAGEDYEQDLTIFKGTPMRCRKAVLGFRNCCKDSGWGVDIGITQCSDEEISLMARQEAKSTHYVGTYCSQSVLGVCIEKAMQYCAFEGTLAKIVHQAGRPQVGMTWGTAKEPDCSGFTIEQFQQLDLSNVDFSEFTDEMMNNITMPDANGTMGRIQQSIEGLMGSGSPGFGEVNEAGDDGP